MRWSHCGLYFSHFSVDRHLFIYPLAICMYFCVYVYTYTYICTNIYTLFFLNFGSPCNTCTMEFFTTSTQHKQALREISPSIPLSFVFGAYQLSWSSLLCRILYIVLNHRSHCTAKHPSQCCNTGDQASSTWCLRGHTQGVSKPYQSLSYIRFLNIFTHSEGYPSLNYFLYRNFINLTITFYLFKVCKVCSCYW